MNAARIGVLVLAVVAAGLAALLARGLMTSPKSEAVVEAHSHPHEQAGMVLEGQAHFFVGEEDRVLGPGDMYCIPGGVTHRVVALNATVKALDVFHPVREDYL